MVGRSSSESLIAGIEVEDPEENHLSDDEPAMIQAAAWALISYQKNPSIVAIVCLFVVE